MGVSAAERFSGPDRGEPLSGTVELAEDAVLDIVAQRGVRAPDQVAQDGDQRGVLGGKAVQLGPGGVDQSHAVIREIGGLDDAGPRVALEAGRDVLAVLLVPVAAGLVRWIGHRRHQAGDTISELLSQHPESTLLTAVTWSKFRGVVFHRVVEQGRAHDVGIADPVVADDPDGHPKQMVEVGLALPPVGGVQARSQVQRPRDAIAVGIVRRLRSPLRGVLAGRSRRAAR